MEKSEKLQDKILEKLNAFGDSLLDDDDSHRSKKKSSKRKNLDDRVLVKKKKKRKKTKSALPDMEMSDDDQNGLKYLKGKERHLAEMRHKLGLTDMDSVECTPKEDPGNTCSPSGPQVIVFEDPAKRKQKRLTQLPGSTHSSRSGSTTEHDSPGDVVFDLRRARHDVKRLGISGLDKQAREQAQMQLALQLGAKAPKNEYINYRKLLEKKKQQQEEAAIKAAEDGKLAKKSSVESKERPKHKKNSLGFVDGQIGYFKDGVQTISKKDIRRINKSKSKR